MGRYGTGGLPDATVLPDGKLALIRSYQALATVEWHAKRLDLYMNAGEEYAQRRYYDDNDARRPLRLRLPTVNLVQSGCYAEVRARCRRLLIRIAIGSTCLANTQRLIEGTVGFWIQGSQRTRMEDCSLDRSTPMWPEMRGRERTQRKHSPMLRTDSTACSSRRSGITCRNPSRNQPPAVFTARGHFCLGDVSCHLAGQIRRIITSVALISAAAAWPGFSCISRAERDVMMDVICWLPMESVTSAISPLMRTPSIRPTS